MKALKSLLLVFAVVDVVISSCSLSAPVVNQIDRTIATKTELSTITATFTLVPEPTYRPAITSTNMPISTISKTRANLSGELYLDENSSPDNIGELNYPEYSYFWNDLGNGYVYHFETEEWVVARPWTRIIPSKDVDTTRHVEGELLQHHIQLWKDGELVYSLPVHFADYPHTLLRYEDHWIFSFGNDWGNQLHIVRDGITLNDLYDYDTAFSLFLIDGKPFFFFRRGDQFGISFHGEEILLPYSNISYGPACCESGGKARWNPRASEDKIGFYLDWGDSEYQYIEIGLRYSLGQNHPTPHP